MGKPLKTQAELLLLLQEARAPLYLYDGIWKWASDAFYRSNPSAKNPFAGKSQRKKVVHELAWRYDLVGIKPVKHVVNLTNAGITIEILTHDFMQCSRQT